MASDKTIIFHIYIPWSKTLPKPRSSVKIKVKYQDHSFQKKWPLRGHSYFANTSCYPRNMAKIIAFSWLLLSTVFTKADSVDLRSTTVTVINHTIVT